MINFDSEYNRDRIKLVVHLTPYQLRLIKSSLRDVLKYYCENFFDTEDEQSVELATDLLKCINVVDESLLKNSENI